MSPTVQIALYGWFFVVLLIFREVKGHRAVTLSFVLGLLFLPTAGLNFPGLPDISKTSINVYACLFCTVIFHLDLLLNFKPRWFDIPMFIFCVAPIASAQSNNLGIGHGISLSLDQFAAWGLPYFIGRMYYRDFESINYLLKWVFIGGLIYIPFCLYEIRMSPQFHRMVYGFFPGSWSVIRFGGYRPSVFMRSGLQLGLWMSFAVLAGYTLLRFKLIDKLFHVRVKYLLAGLFVVAILCKATGAILLLGLGWIAMVEFRQMRTWFVPMSIGAIVVVYLVVRSFGLNDGSELVKATRAIADDRAQSIEFRFVNEDLLAAKAMKRPLLGWGGNGRNKVENEHGVDKSITDGFWIIVFGNFGFVGLVSIFSTFVIMPILALNRFTGKAWNSRDVATTICLSIFLLMYTFDNLLNAMPAGLYPLALGAISTLYGMRTSKLKPDEDLNEEYVTIPRQIQRHSWPPKRLEDRQLVS